MGNNVFSEFKIKSSTIATRNNGRSMGFGFVEFETAEDQKKALEYNDKEVDGRKIVVKIANNYLGPNRPKRAPRNNNNGDFYNRRPFRRNFRRGFNRGFNRGGFNRGGFNRGGYQRNSNSLYVTNLPFDLDGKDVLEIFNEFNPKDAYVVTRRNGSSRGFGFVEFYNKNAKLDALNALNKCEVNGRIITIEEQRGSRRTFSQNRPRFPRRNRPRPEEREQSPTMIFVANIPFSLSDKEFEAIFEGFKVKKAFVALTRNGRSRGFGFVDFENQEEQQRAIKEKQGVESQGRQLALRVAYKANDDKNNTNNDDNQTPNENTNNDN